MKRFTARLSSLLLSRRDDGYSTETVIVTAMLALAALAAVGVISGAVSDWVSQIPTE